MSAQAAGGGGGRTGAGGRAKGAGARVQARPALVLVIPSQTDFLAIVRDATKKMAEAAGFDATEADRLALAVDEATTNVLEHAYAGATDRTVEIRIDDQGSDLRVGDRKSVV